MFNTYVRGFEEEWEGDSRGPYQGITEKNYEKLSE